ncbi:MULTISPECIES: gamma carbonic anhydrase family protein [Caproicibacterium]|mgnify:CR=1 FL=1|jgi:carbonic anhydrase/acetyltransferase-like protein (isoleucine patch superfamily)|uniref:Gamma carbonic anhydrase family protein n=1 Tax=Caproicibacterium lactatifermentans TaxID=2666138 RepID=A0A859DU36_9FIRM|nr:gamma carbonic anhydrase family protein [Caproicibacterium lactatifermentans]ARP50735.1 gamma carbonic anhydrase family protein [Ruminococcaceae bacterium CPB6]MDD4807024.1 gamma carbonic anhydrase family protein [Oscillospiraceae bacterium]QKN23531.1 gamma carbonic anhydrase family protein [Caproicibacterium lactatifermentans]QKO29790.1 gamma carbonic anhydrase family protein [Caproicibacterium lactatifermentans]
MLNEKKPVLAQGAVVTGNVTFGKDCSVWYNTVIRGDTAPISVGEGTNIQDCCVLHVDEGRPLYLGNGVTVGHGAILHGCTVGDNTVIGMGAVLLNGASVGKNSIVAAGALVSQDHTFPDGVLLMGCPAKVKRALTEEEIAENRHNAEHYIQQSKIQLSVD